MWGAEGEGKMGLRIFAWVAVLCATLVSAAGAQEGEPLRIATEGAYPPFSFVGPDGNVAGFDVDIANQLCLRLNRPCDIQVVEFDSLIPSLLARKFDVIVASLTITEERAKRVDFTIPYYRNKLQFIAPKDVDFEFHVDDIAGKTIGAQRSSVSAAWLKDNLEDRVTVRLYPDTEAAFLDLQTGRLDLVLNDILGSYDFLNRPEGADFDYFGNPVLEDDRIGIALRKGELQLQNDLNNAIRAMLTDGTYVRLSRKYFPFDIF